MLSQPFIDWWFAPWEYASASTKLYAQLAPDALALRDGYRYWCTQHAVVADLPAPLDPAWEVAAFSKGQQFQATARLFAGIIAAREQHQTLLSTLPFAERKWCVSIAATQPLKRCSNAGPQLNESLDLLGLSEIAARLESDFAGMWSRLRLLLPPGLAQQVDSVLPVIASKGVDFSTQSARVLRCWRMCRNRVEAITDLSSLVSNSASEIRVKPTPSARAKMAATAYSAVVSRINAPRPELN